MTLETAKFLSTKDVEIYFYTQPYLHAKLYHLEYRKGYFRSFVGSSNFTIGGLKNNHEVVAEMEGVGDNSPCHQEIQRLLGSRGTLCYQSWIAKYIPRDSEKSI